MGLNAPGSANVSSLWGIWVIVSWHLDTGQVHPPNLGNKYSSAIEVQFHLPIPM